MAVPEQTPYNIYTANGVTTVFPYEFYILQAGDLAVSIDGENVTTGFTVSGVGTVNGGEVTFLVAPAAGGTVMLERSIPAARTTDYQDNGDLLADTVNKDFDRIWMAIRQAFISLGLALTRPLFGGPFNAKGYRISDVGDPVNDQDAATKKWAQGQDIESLNKSLRITESYIAPLPPLSEAEGKTIIVQGGAPRWITPESGTATDVLVQLSKRGGAGLIGGVSKPVTFFGAIGNGISDDTSAFMQAELSPYNDIYIPEGEFVVDNINLNKRYHGPGMISRSGIGDISYSGSGINDITFSGIYNGVSHSTIYIKIATVGTDDTIKWSVDGVNFIDTHPVYNPITDSYDDVPIYASSTPYLIGLGVSVAFSSQTGHSLDDAWSVSLVKNPKITQSDGGFYQNDKNILSTLGIQQLRVGLDALGSGRSIGSGNTAIGFRSLFSNTIGYANVAIGPDSLRFNTSGFFNVAMGSQSLEVNTTGYNNTAIGQFSMQYNKTGRSNVAIGSDTLGYQTSGDDNTGVGVQALYTNVSGGANVALGRYALRGGSSSLRPTITTQQAAFTEGNNSIQLSAENPLVAQFQLVTGEGLQDRTTVMSVSGITVIIDKAPISSGNSLFTFGYTDEQLSPDYSTALGASALYNTRRSSHNVAVGFEALWSNTSGQYNTGVGSESGFRITFGAYNVFMGYMAGGGVLQSPTASNCVVIGDGAYSTGDNAIAIGSGVKADAQQIVIGNFGHTGLYHFGSLYPQLDNTFSIGSPTARYSTVYATTGAINTSDETRKTPLEPLSSREKSAALEIKSAISKFKFIESVNQKGSSGARWHFGVGAQTVGEIMRKHDLNPDEYGFWCFDEWEEEFEAVMKEAFSGHYETMPDGSSRAINKLIDTGEKRLIRSAGASYGIRYDELAMFIISAI